MNRTRILLVCLLALVLGACAEVGATDVGLKYGQGPIEGEHFEEIVEPGSGQKWVWNDEIKTLPITQREYTFCAAVRQDAGANGCDAPPIRVTARGGAEIDISGGVTFELASGNPDTVKQFYEDVCRKFGCDDEDDGWAEMLRVNMRNPLEDSLQEAARRYSVDALYAGVPGEGEDIDDAEAQSTLTKVTTDIEKGLRETINAFMGGQFFCGPGYERSDPDNCPDFEFVITEVTPVSETVKQAFDANVASRQAVIDARNRAEAARVEAEGVQEAQEALAGSFRDPAWLAYERIKAEQKCASNPNCVLIIGDDNANVNVTPKDG
jgi:regulator of protease activity HflC (stomatin/prohibitin superfamily)